MPAVAGPRRTSAKLIAAVVIVPLLLAVGTMVAVALALNGDKAADLDPAEAVNIRIHNGMDGDIDRLWLGRGVDPASADDPAFHTRYDGIDQGADSRYLTVGPELVNYDSLNLTIDGRSYTAVRFDLQLGLEPLPVGGYYTIMLSQDGDQAVVTQVTTDPAPA